MNLAVMVGSDIDYVVVEADGTGRRRYLLAEARLAGVRPRARRRPGEPSCAAAHGRRPRRADLRAAVLLLRGATRTRSASCAADDASPPPTAPGWCTRAGAFGEVDKEVTDREGIAAVMPVGKDGRFTAPVDRVRRACWSSTPTCTSSTTSRRHPGRGETGSVTPGTVLLRRETYDHCYPHCWRCRETLIYKGVSSLVRRGDRVQAADARAQPGDPLGARARQGRPVRQVAGERPRLVDHPQPVLGLPGPGLESATTRRTRGSTSTARSRSSRPTSAAARPDGTRPAPPVRRRPDAAEPGRPDRGSRRCAASPTSSTCGSTRAR